MDMLSMEMVCDSKMPVRWIGGCARRWPQPPNPKTRCGFLQMALREAVERDRRAVPPAGVRNIDIVSAIRGICRQTEIRAEVSGKSIAFSSNIAALRMRTNAALLMRTVQNLVANALLNAPCGARIGVCLNAMSDFVEIALTDCARGRNLRNWLDGGYDSGLNALGGSLRADSDGNGRRLILRLPAR